MFKRTMYEIGQDYLTDKITHHRYDRFYPIFLEKFRDKIFNMCEIGIYQCESLLFWADYFPKSTIYGIDIQDKKYCDLESSEFPTIKTFKADQSNLEDLEKICNQIDLCDFIIDDGSHMPEHQYKTFKILFEKKLNYGGVYIIEDIEGSYWKKINDDYKKYGYKFTDKNIFQYLENVYDQINNEFSKVDNNLNISTITYAHNCIIMTKRTQEEIELCKRPYRFRDKI